jgi:hypothetical protein
MLQGFPLNYGVLSTVCERFSYMEDEGKIILAVPAEQQKDMVTGHFQFHGIGHGYTTFSILM